MAMAITQMYQALKTKGYLDDIMAFASGLLDGFLIDKAPWAFLIKNIGLPVASFFLPVPEGVRHESEGMLGFAVYLLIK